MASLNEIRRKLKAARTANVVLIERSERGLHYDLRYGSKQELNDSGIADWVTSRGGKVITPWPEMPMCVQAIVPEEHQLEFTLKYG